MLASYHWWLIFLDLFGNFIRGVHAMLPKWQLKTLSRGIRMVELSHMHGYFHRLEVLGVYIPLCGSKNAFYRGARIALRRVVKNQNPL